MRRTQVIDGAYHGPPRVPRQGVPCQRAAFSACGVESLHVRCAQGYHGWCIAVIFSDFTENFRCAYSVRISES